MASSALERISAITTGGFAVAAGGIVSALEHFGYQIPDAVWIAYAVGSAALLFICLTLFSHMCWKWLQARGSESQLSHSQNTQTIATLPPFMGWPNRLDLAGVASLKIHVPYSSTSLTMVLDPVEISIPLDAEEQVSVDGASYYTTAPEIIFDDGDNKRKIIEVAGKLFTVTLLSVDTAPTPGVAMSFKYTFSVVER